MKWLISYINNKNRESATSATVSTFCISVLDALNNMRWAWDRVSTETVANCFRHGGFVEPSQSTEENTCTDTHSLANGPGIVGDEESSGKAGKAPRGNCGDCQCRGVGLCLF